MCKERPAWPPETESGSVSLRLEKESVGRSRGTNEKFYRARAFMSCEWKLKSSANNLGSRIFFEIKIPLLESVHRSAAHRLCLIIFLVFLSPVCAREQSDFSVLRYYYYVTRTFHHIRFAVTWFSIQVRRPRFVSGFWPDPHHSRDSREQQQKCRVGKAKAKAKALSKTAQMEIVSCWRTTEERKTLWIKFITWKLSVARHNQ